MERWMLLLLVLGSVAARGIGAERPHVMLVVSDDHGWGDVGWNSPEVRTPVLDRMAADGVRLDRFYANPICSVTRAALMTGMATLRTGVNNRRGLELQHRLLPQAFRDAGYQTWMCGKWHLGGSPDNQFSGPEYLPQSRGFDYFYGHLHGAIDYYTHQNSLTGSGTARRCAKKASPPICSCATRNAWSGSETGRGPSSSIWPSMQSMGRCNRRPG
jgi:arylsulfatase A-like enzyme